MFDNLRQQASGSSPFVDADQEAEPLPQEVPAEFRESKGNFLGLTAVQRFVLALMLFLNVAVLGCFCLLATEKVWLTF